MSKEYASRFFPTKIPLNMHKCPLRVGYMQWSPNVMDWTDKIESGVEIEFILSVIKSTNMSLILTRLSHKPAKMNETYLTVGNTDFQVCQFENGFLLKVDHIYFSIILKKLHLDILIGGIVASIERSGQIISSDLFLANSLVWIVPTATEIPKSETMWLLLDVNIISRIIEEFPLANCSVYYKINCKISIIKFRKFISKF